MFRVLGVDASSTSAGVAIIEDGIPVRVDVHKSNKKLDLGRRLYEWGLFLDRFRAKQKIDLVALEKLTSFRNKQTSRMLIYFGAIPLQKAGQWNVPTIELEVKTIRKKAFGSGSAGKEQVYQHYAKILNLSPYESGGNDMSDACAVGVAGHKLYDRN
jgi:Holliday junction resolvasome RuvABC endonuclease subunit